MPPSASTQPAAIIAEYTTLTNLNYCGIAGFVLILHDYVVTFRQEVNMFWMRKLNGAAILFYLNRYAFIIVNAIYQLTTHAPISNQVSPCPTESRLAFGIRAVVYVVWASFAGLRAYALSCSWPLGAFVFLLQSVPIGVNLSLFHFGVTGIPLPRLGCELSDFVSKTLSRRYAIASRSCVITADFILICITWFTLSRRRLHSEDHKMTFSSVLLRDGTIYFVVLFVLNCVHLTLTLLAFNPAFQDASYLPSFTEPITAILVSRFLLDLQYANHRSIGMTCWESSTHPEETGDGSTSTLSLTFEKFVDSIGASIISGYRGEDDFEDEMIDLSVFSSHDSRGEMTSTACRSL